MIKREEALGRNEEVGTERYRSSGHFPQGFREERGLVRRGYSLGEPRTTTGVAILVLSPGGPAWSQAPEHGEQV